MTPCWKQRKMKVSNRAFESERAKERRAAQQDVGHERGERGKSRSDQRCICVCLSTAKGGVLMCVRRYLSILAISMSLADPVGAQQGCAVNSLGQVICAPPGGGAAVNSLGQVVTGRGGCAVNSLGQVVCANSPGGGAISNSLGQVQTGPGQCVRDSLGRVMCSSQPGGGAAVNSLGQAVCAGGCVPGR